MNSIERKPYKKFFVEAELPSQMFKSRASGTSKIEFVK